MHRTIDFPNLGIHLKSVGDHITVFGFDSAYYGIVIGIGILAGLMMAVMEAKRTHQNVEDYNDIWSYLFNYRSKGILCDLLLGYV